MKGQVTMKLQELLKKHYGADEAKLNALLEDMRTNNIFTAGEENLDIRFNKLKSKNDALELEHAESLKLIEELKKSNVSNEALSKQIADYEAKVKVLEEQNTALTIENAVKVRLLEKGAKPNDIDYLIFRIGQGDELKLDKDGNVKGLDDRIADLQKTYSGNFVESVKKKVDVKELPDDEKEKATITKEEFNKMGYADRNKLYQENKELYDTLTNKE